jgi:hypothetical protein
VDKSLHGTFSLYGFPNGRAGRNPLGDTVARSSAYFLHFELNPPSTATSNRIAAATVVFFPVLWLGAAPFLGDTSLDRKS